ncbi:MAG TPA: acyl-CoA dehydrogenase family protein [Woeseiaceae bacterium]|nr:acyl-CoA dehydrogenase family protein [Woeseiaceae bacterium]
MDFALSDEQRILQDEIRRFATTELNAADEGTAIEAGFPKDRWLRCGEMRLQGLPVPEELGGAGLDPLSTAIALEALGYGCRDGGLVFAVCAHLLACVVPIWKHGSEAQQRKYLPELCSGRLIAVNGMTEPGTGSDAFAMKTRAVEKSTGFVLNGAKIFSSNGPVSGLAIVYAATDPERGYHGGITAFLVETGTEGFRAGQTFRKMGLHSCPIGELILDDVFVPEDAVIGKVGEGAAIFSESMDWERACLVAAHLGTMEWLLERAIEYSRTRKQSGQPISKFQAVSHRIVDIKVRLEAARYLTYKAADGLNRPRTASMDASIAKLYVSESLLTSAIDTLRVFGGYGLMEEYGIERVVRDSVAGTIYSGTSDIQRNIIARWLGLL